MFVFRKIWRALFSCYFHFKICPFASLPTIRFSGTLQFHHTKTSQLIYAAEYQKALQQRMYRSEIRVTKKTKAIPLTVTMIFFLWYS